jgi:biotin operon repressor
MIDLMRGVHTAYAPANEPFGSRLETFFIGLCVALGHIDGKPFSVAKIAAYMGVPRSTVIRRLDRLQRWGLVYRQGRGYYIHDKALNSFIGTRSYRTTRRLLRKATEELTILDTLPDWRIYGRMLIGWSKIITPNAFAPSQVGRCKLRKGGTPFFGSWVSRTSPRTTT